MLPKLDEIYNFKTLTRLESKVWKDFILHLQWKSPSPKQIVGPKKSIGSEKKFWVRIIMSLKNFGSIKILGLKIFGSKDIVQKKFFKKIWLLKMFQRNFGSKKNLVKKNWVPFFFKEIFGLK